MPKNVALLNAPNRIETPFIKVTFGEKDSGYTFGVFNKTKSNKRDQDGFYESIKVNYPNYIDSLTVTKINGKVNQYTLILIYPVTQNDDPNFFEKVFSSISKTRKAIFSYGDMSLPTYIYRDEQAIVTDIKTSFDIKSSVITYTVSAVSAANLLSSGSYTFINSIPKKPSDEIKNLLYNKTYGLQEIFYGMNNPDLVAQAGLIPGDDMKVQLETKTNISALEYLSYLVSCMIPASGSLPNVKQRDIYILTIIDDTTGEFGGPYFKIVRSSKEVNNSDAYEIDIGYPTANIVLSFNVNNNENYSIFYDWQKKLNGEEYAYRINDDGELEQEYAPIISSRNNEYKTRISDQTWWTKITEYPISATLILKGLLRPAILMTHVRLNVYFYGWKHIASGLYIVTQQQDSISKNGFTTTLSLTRISGEEIGENQV